MAEIYQQGPKSWDVQLVEIFDPERDRFMHHFGESMTRTPGKDYSYLILQRMNDFRRTTQLQAAIQGLFGMMKHQIIPTTDGKNIKYFDAWELKDGKIQLKPNVDPTWGITYTPEGEQKLGAKFLQKRNEYQRALDNMNGAMSKEDSPEAERYLAFRYVSFFRRFLTAMLMNRFAKNRVDYQLGDFKEGFYWTFLKLMGNSFKTLGRNLPNMNATEKQAVFRVMTEAGTILLMKYLLLATILGFDDDDEDRYAKLRKNSDALPLWFVHDDPSREFNMAGWLKNHAILQTMQISAENSQFYPFPGWGLNNYKDFFNLKSMAMGPTINTYLDIVGDAYYMATGNEKAKYQRDASAYDWGRQGDYKLWNHVGKSFGFTSSTVEPAIAVRNFQNIQSR
jgi:hypothetical protein